MLTKGKPPVDTEIASKLPVGAFAADMWLNKARPYSSEQQALMATPPRSIMHSRSASDLEQLLFSKSNLHGFGFIRGG